MWVLLALATAILTAGREAIIKRATRSVDGAVLMAGMTAVAAAVLLPFALASATVPARAFWPALVVSGGINAVAALLLPYALRRSDLSLVSPLQSFTPAFMLVTAPLILGERPSTQGLAGVVAIVCGAWLLNAPVRGKGVLSPLAALGRDPGARATLGIAFLYSISATVDKVGVRASSPLLWAAAVSLFVAAALTPAALRATRRRTGIRPGAAIATGGLALGLAGAAQMTALTMAQAAYVIGVKRTSVVFGVLFGGLLFGERGLGRRLAGAGVMLIGVLLITLA